jgi:hypothetical protein
MFTTITKPTESQKTYRCPCCHFKTLYGRGQDEIRPVCFWEDDGQDDHGRRRRQRRAKLYSQFVRSKKKTMHNSKPLSQGSFSMFDHPLRTKSRE